MIHQSEDFINDENIGTSKGTRNFFPPSVQTEFAQIDRWEACLCHQCFEE